jgi:hypothetical protein
MEIWNILFTLPVLDVFPLNEPDLLNFSRNVLGGFHCIRIANKSFRTTAELKCLGVTVMNKT